ncbi:CPBP family intramembrane glutamic endopeptidase [Rubritalea spongiae]|uniref:CPBP family intramembrane glutamic endopeptidase n=1 Tax=Rubritalea spongiae TaxID=430797 RepID=A0ABW5E0P4_9BACT
MLQLALSQGAFGHQVLQDIGFICLISIVLAGLLHAWLRKTTPSLQWNQSGKVDTSRIAPADIIGCIFVTLPFTHTLFLSYAGPGRSLTPIELAISFGMLLMMSGIVLFMYKQRDMLPEALGLSPKHPAYVFAWGVAVYVGFILLSIVLQHAGLEAWLESRLGEPEHQQIVQEMINAVEVERKLILILGTCIIAPLAEEIIFRGYLYPVLKRYTEPVFAAIVTGIIFGAIHGNIWAVIPLSLFGILLAALYEWSGSIWSCILCHALFNSINVAFMLSMGDQL